MEVTLGNLATIATIAGGWIWFFAGLKGKIDLLTQRLSSLEATISQLSIGLVQLAKQEVRLDSHAERIQHLEKKLES